jgi:hypothetical protein
MRYIKSYNKFKDPMNEEFIGGLIKGALGKLASFFMAPFKDMVNDIKNAFKDNDPNGIKNMIVTNLDKAIDGMQKQISTLTDEQSVRGVMDQFIKQLTELANGMGKDFDSALGNKSPGPKMVAQAVLVGTKNIKGWQGPQWGGIIGELQDKRYSYSKYAYQKALLDASKAGGNDTLKAQKAAAYKFFDGFQKQIKIDIDKSLNEGELKKIVQGVGGNTSGVMNYEKLKELYDRKTPVMYKMDGYDEQRKPEEQKNKIGTKVMDTLNDQGEVGFKGEKGTFKKKYEDILGPAQGQTTTPTGEKGPNAQSLATELGKIATDEDKMGKIAKFTQIVSDDNNKNRVDQVLKQLGVQPQQPISKAA